jgi:hypothetical protein
MAWLSKLLVAYVLLATTFAGYSGLIAGIDWRADQGIAAMILSKYEDASNFQLEHALYGSSDFVRTNAAFLKSHSLSVFRARENTVVPVDVQEYSKPPKSYKRVMEKFPNDVVALAKLW